MAVHFMDSFDNPPFSEDEKLLLSIAQEYRDRTEAYDQRICEFRNERGVAIPVTVHERLLCTKYAIEVRKDIESRGFDWNEIKKYLRYLED